MNNRETLSHCAEQARRMDPDRYFCALLAPARRREALFALYAFNGEIARVRETVSEPMLGMIRLQWWRDAIAAIYDGSPPRHAIAEPLAGAIAAHGLPRQAFDRLIDARELDLDDAPVENLAALEDYAAATSSTLTGLALTVLDADDEAAQTAGRQVGIAWALCGLLRALPFHARARRLYLPADAMAAEGVDREDVFAASAHGNLHAVVAGVAAAAEAHLQAARALRHSVARQALPALLLARLVDSDLGRLKRAGFDPFDPRVAAAGIGRKLRLLTGTALGRY